MISAPSLLALAPQPEEALPGRAALERKAMLTPPAGRALDPGDLPAARRLAPVPSLPLSAGQAGRELSPSD